MGKYTTYNNPDVENKIQSDIDLIKNTLNEKIKGIIALYLTGGFGKGEGSVVVENGMVKNLNDYDLELITSSPPAKEALNEIKNELQQKTGVLRIDIEIHTPANLRKAEPSIYFYDLKFGSIPLIENKNAVNQMPEFKQGYIKPFECFYLLMTRLMALFNAHNFYFDKTSASIENKHTALKQISKVILACVDVDLILGGQYHHQNAHKLENLKSLNNLVYNKEYFKIAQWAVNFKLKPSVEAVPDFFQCSEIFKEHIISFFSFYFGDINPEKSIKDLFRRPKSILRRMYFFLRRKTWYKEYLNLSAAGLYLLFSLKQDGSFEKEYLEKAEKYFSKIDLINLKKFLNGKDVSEETLRFSALKDFYNAAREKMF